MGKSPDSSTARRPVESLVVALLAALRVYGVKHSAFQAVAHLYVGWLFRGWFLGRLKFDLMLAIVLTLVETVCFFLMPR